MEIKPETVKKVAYPALAAVMAAALSSCQQQQQYPEQRCSGSGLSSVDLKAYGFLIGQQTTTETKVEPPQRLGGIPLAPKKSSSTKH